MNELQTAYIARAQTALALAAGDPGHSKSADFIDFARTLLAAADPESAWPMLRAHQNPAIAKAAAATLDGVTWGVDAATLAAHWVTSISPASAFDQIVRYGRAIDPKAGRAMVASGVVGDVVAEGDPKIVRDLDVTAGDIPRFKPCGIMVASRELARATGAAGRHLFEAELAAAVGRAMNAAVLGAVTDSSAIGAASTGNPLGDLRAGLAVAPASDAFVVLAGPGAVADLATRAEARGGMSIRGGDFVPGISVVAVDGLTTMVIIPASRAATTDAGLQVRSAGHASLDLRDSPTAPAHLVNLWQTNCVGLLIEREIGLLLGDPAVIVGGGS